MSLCCACFRISNVENVESASSFSNHKVTECSGGKNTTPLLFYYVRTTPVNAAFDRLWRAIEY